MRQAWNRVCGVAALVAVVAGVAGPARGAVLLQATYNGKVYQLLDAGADGARTQQAYEDYAQGIHSSVHLVTIEDAAENTWLFDTFTSAASGFNASAYIGFYQPNPGTNEPGTPGQGGDDLGFWRWYSDPTNSAGNTYTAWGSGEPNNSGGNEHAAQLYNTTPVRWNDINGANAYNGIIEFPAGFLFPHPVAELSVYGATIGGRAYIYDPNTNTTSVPDRYVLEARPAGQSTPGMLGQYCTAYPQRDIGGNRWSVFTSLASIQAYMAGQTVITQQLTGHAIDFPVGNGNDGPSGVNPFADIGIQVGDNGYTDHFIGYWSGSFNVTTAGTGTFWTASDDGSVLFIDGNLVVDNNYFQGVVERTGTYDLSLGEHEMVIAFFENDGGAGVTASWQLPGMSAREYIPADSFVSQPEFQVLSDLSGVQVGDLLATGIFPPDGRFGLDNGVYELRLTVWGAYDMAQVTAIVALVPEPTTLALLGVGLIALARRRRRQTTHVPH